MNIKLLFFAQLRDLAGSAVILMDIEGAPDVSDLLVTLSLEHASNPAFVAALQDPSLMISVNQQLVNKSRALNEGDEIGFLPPVSGG